MSKIKNPTSLHDMYYSIYTYAVEHKWDKHLTSLNSTMSRVLGHVNHVLHSILVLYPNNKG